jgi:hypothetical protein
MVIEAKMMSTKNPRNREVIRVEHLSLGYGEEVVLESTRDVADTLDRQLTGIPAGALADLVSRLTNTVTLTQNLVSTLDQQVAESSVLLRRALQRFDQLAVQLTTLAETIQQKPSRLLIPSEKADPFDM